MLNKLENWLFYLFLFVIPISLRHIFWFEPFNFIEWTAIYIYATDILFLTLLIFWAVNRKREMVLNPDPGNQSRRFPQLRWPPFRYWVKDHLSLADISLLIFVLVAGVSIRNALDVPTAVFTWLKLLEGVALYFYVKNYALSRFSLNSGFMALVLGGLFQSVIAIAQFIMQGSLGLKYLGESPLVPAFSGIAAFFVDGIKIMRAYGTTPHSNVLALYLFIALGAFYTLSVLEIRNSKLEIARSAWWWHFCHAVILWAFFLTFSRVIIGLWGVSFILMSLLVTRTLKPSSGRGPSEAGETDGTGFPGLGERVWVTNSRKIFWTTVAVGVLFVAVYWPYVANRSVISSSDEAVQLRVLYNHESLANGQNIFGVGMGNFVPWLMTQDLHLNREIYQPVHNIYLLIYSETGILGIALFILFLAFLLYDFYNRLFAQYININFRSAKPQASRCCITGFGLVIISVLVFGLFDHYLWTIQSGRLIFWLVLGFLASAE